MPRKGRRGGGVWGPGAGRLPGGGPGGGGGGVGAGGRPPGTPCGGRGGGSPKIEPNCAAAGAASIAPATAKTAAQVRRLIAMALVESAAGGQFRTRFSLVNTLNTAAEGRAGSGQRPGR